MTSAFDTFRVTGIYQPATLGRARVEVQEVTPIASILAACRGERLHAGEQVTMLFVDGRMMMSDTRDEWRSQRQFVDMAHGRVLVNGLGLGCVLRVVLAKSQVEHVDVVEVERDVIALVSPYFAEAQEAGRVTFHCADAFTVTWPVGTRWDVAYHDIWSDICTDDLKEHARLFRRYARRVDWQDCWKHRELLAHRRREQRESAQKEAIWV